MRWLLDSNVLIDALAGLARGVRVLQEARKRPEVSVVYSAITRIEVLGLPNLSEQEEAAVRRLLNEFDEIAVTNAVIERTIQIRKAVRIKIPDALIAASAETAQAIIVTRNTSDFQRVPGLTVVHPDNV
ncbi:MAG: type II toxin-antitoxin system VapC family toxin [Verrucomicrobiota bacterium]|jgi:predicted nucleic acid-binding protein